jgi:hypothetical protein
MTAAALLLLASVFFVAGWVLHALHHRRPDDLDFDTFVAEALRVVGPDDLAERRARR